jgi:hypothetical protein
MMNSGAQTSIIALPHTFQQGVRVPVDDEFLALTTVSVNSFTRDNSQRNRAPCGAGEIECSGEVPIPNTTYALTKFGLHYSRGFTCCGRTHKKATLLREHSFCGMLSH